MAVRITSNISSSPSLRSLVPKNEISFRPVNQYDGTEIKRLYHADNLDATIEQIRTAGEKAGESRWSDRIYTLNNRPHLTPLYVNEAFASHEETV